MCPEDELQRNWSIKEQMITQHQEALEMDTSQIISGTFARSILAAGNANRVLVNDSSGLVTDAAAITPSRALISDANGLPTHSATTSTELGHVSGVTSAIQTQLNTKSLILLATYLPSSSASVDITSVLSATYEAYLVSLNILPETDDVDLWLRTDDANGASFDTGAGDYSWEILNNELSLGAVFGNNSDSKIVLAGNSLGSVGNSSSEGVSGFFVFSRFQFMSTGLFTFRNSGANTVGVATFGQRFGGGTVNALQILFESGDIGQGTVRVYGLKNS